MIFWMLNLNRNRIDVRFCANHAIPKIASCLSVQFSITVDADRSSTPIPQFLPRDNHYYYERG